MRVLSFLLNNYDYRNFIRGGEARFIQVSRYLQALGVDFSTLEYPSSNSSHFEPLGYSSVKVPLILKNPVFSAFIAILFGLTSCLKKRCQLVYVPGRLSWDGGKWVGVIAPYIVSIIFRIPLVIIFHHVQPWGFKEKNPLTLRAYRRANSFAVSGSTARDVQRAYGLSNIRIIGNGLDTNQYDEIVVDKKEYHATFLGRIEENKGVFDLMQAWKDVIEILPDAKLILIGPMRDEVSEKVNDLLSDLDISDNVTFTGYISEEKKGKFLKSSKIFVFPSKIEGFGLAVLEAMASELPCILSDIPALREIFSGHALFVPPCDATHLAREIIKLLDDDKLQAELIEKGKALAVKYSWESVALNEYNHLREILSEHSS